MMVQYGLRHHAYLDVAKHYHKVWETPSIKEDVQDKGKTVRGDLITPTFQPDISFKALEHIVYYVALSPHDNEQSDMMHRLFVDPALEKLEVQ
jgi:26S proteasome regulatory subunit N5